MLDHDLDHLCRGRRFHKSGLSDSGILSNQGASSVYADTALATCPSQCGSLAMTSTFAAVNCDTDAACAVKTAQGRSTTPTLKF